MVNSKRTRIREYTDGDEVGILELFHTVFGHKSCKEQWKWKYIENIQGKGWISLAERNNEIVAHYGMMHNNLNMVGQTIVAGQSSDTMVRKDQQGKGLFIKLALKDYEIAQQSGVSAVFGFPNRNSYPGFIRRLGWHRIATLKCYYYHLGYRKLVGRLLDKILKRFNILYHLARYYINLLKMRKDVNGIIQSFQKIIKNHGKTKIQATLSLPSNIDDIIMDNLRYEILSVWKDSSYLKWRYEDHPYYRYVFHTLYHDGIPEAVVVCREDDEIVYICDLIIKDKDAWRAQIMVRHLILYYMRSRTQKIEFYGHDNGFFDLIFAASGFIIDPVSPLVLCGLVFNDESLQNHYYYPDSWTITYGDTDIA